MMPNNRSKHYTRYRQGYTAEYSKTARTYRENNSNKIITRQKIARRRNVEPSRLHNENE